MPEKELFPLNRLVFFLDSVGQIAREDHSKKLKIKTNKQFICTLYILYNPTIPAKIQSQYQFLRRARHFPGFCLRMFRSSRRCVSSSGPPRGWGWARPCRSPWWWTGSRSRGHPCWRRRSRWSSQDTPGCRSSPAAINILHIITAPSHSWPCHRSSITELILQTSLWIMSQVWVTPS